MPPPDKRQHLIATAYERFKRDGFHAVGVDRIIAEADVAKMTLYRHFPSKDDLIVAVLDRRAERFEKQLARLAVAPGSARDRILAIFTWYARWVRRADFHGCIFAHAIAEYGGADSPVFRRAAAQKQALRRHMGAILRAELPARRADKLAGALLILIEGATLLAQMEEGERAIAIARDAAVTLVAAEGLAA